MLLRARIVLPISRPAIEDGYLAVTGNRITSVGRWKTLPAPERKEVVDLGQVMLLPGLINAHCHLDYTALAGKLPPPANFVDWIKAMVTLKAQCSINDFAQSWQSGAAMLLRSGTTTVADVEAVPELIPTLWSAVPLRVISFRELICLNNGPDARANVEAAIHRWSKLSDTRNAAGLSPHAPYTTTPQVLELAARTAEQHHWRLTTHLAESEEEFEMFMYRQGALYEWLKNQRDMSDCGLGSPVRHLERCGYLDANLLAVHVNYLSRDDAAALGRQGVSVAHCPRSHEYFGHLRFPREELTRAGVNLCLGTDSLASVRKPARQEIALDLFAEMAAMAKVSPELAPQSILKMATVHAAHALGRQGQIGELSEQSLADLIAVPYPGGARDVHDALIHHAGPVAAVMIDGRWAIPPEGLPRV
jgi:aminodeoxyfutalosine deaminase